MRPNRSAIPLGRDHSCSLDDLVGADKDRVRDGEAERSCRLEIDDQLEPGRLFHRKIAGLCAAQELGELPAHGVSPQGNNQRPIADQPALLCHLRPLVHRSRSARARSKIKAQLLKTSADAGTLRPSAPAAFAASMALPISSRWATEWIESSMPRARAASSSALRSISCPHLQKVAGG